MSIVFFGTPEFAVPSLKYLIDAGEEIIAVVSQEDKRRGRGGKTTPSPVKSAAMDAGIKILTPQSTKDESFMAEMNSIKPEFFVVVAYGKILSHALLDIPSIAPVNLHASLLPKYRGAAPIAMAVINGDTETGACTMHMKFELDEGDILLKKILPITNEDTTGTLSDKLSGMGGELLKQTIDEMREGTLKGTPQEGEPSYVKKFAKEDGHLHWEMSALEIFNHVRGMQPWPGAYCYIGGKRIKLLKVMPVEGQYSSVSKIAEVHKNSFMVSATGGLIEVLEVQPEGKKAMPASAYLQGNKIEQGMEVF